MRKNKAWRWALAVFVGVAGAGLLGGEMLQAAKGGPPQVVPGGPGLIVFYDSASGMFATINPDGTGFTPLTPGDGFTIVDWSPVFSDGSVKIAFGEFDPNTQEDRFMVMDVLPVPAEPAVVLSPPFIDGVMGGVYQVEWSPVLHLEDGTDYVRVAYATFDIAKTGGSLDEYIAIQDLIYDPSTGQFTAVGPPVDIISSDPNFEFLRGRFSPDGSVLALERFERATGHRTIWVVNADGTNPQPLIDGAGTIDRFPAWSPDGASLAFISNRPAGKKAGIDLYVYDLATATTRRLTTDTVSEQYPTWSPDSLQIAFQGAASGRVVLQKVMLDTGQKFTLGAGYMPDWSPALP